MENLLIERIVTLVAQEFHVPPQQITERRRERVLADARHLVMFIAHESGEYIPRIAAYFGLSDQAVRYGVNTAREGVKRNPGMRWRYDRVHEALFR